MTNYTDVEKANSLIAEQTRLETAIKILDDGGTVTNFTVSPPPLPAAGITPPPPPPGPTTTMLPVSIMTIDPSPELLSTARRAMVDRYNAITTELEALGVTGAPEPTR